MKMRLKTLRALELQNAVLHLILEWVLHDCAETLQCDSATSLPFQCDEEEKQGTDRGCKGNLLKSCDQSTGSHPKSCQLYQLPTPYIKACPVIPGILFCEISCERLTAWISWLGKTTSSCFFFGLQSLFCWVRYLPWQFGSGRDVLVSSCIMNSVSWKDPIYTACWGWLCQACLMCPVTQQRKDCGAWRCTLVS